VKTIALPKVVNEDKLASLAVTMPNRYVKRADGTWSCPPGEAVAHEMGMVYVDSTSVVVEGVSLRKARVELERLRVADG
jgi:hypothetical protein